MKDTRKLLIKIIDIYAIIVFFACVQVPSIIRVIHGERYLQAFRVLIIAMCLLFFLTRKKFPHKMGFIILWAFVTLISTWLSGNDMGYAIQIISIPFLMCLFLSANLEKIDRILRIWKNILTILVLIDFLTIVMFPNGMYNDGLYDLNWFLGYKTARFALELPLCTLSAYLEEKYTDKVGVKTYILIFISSFCTMKSQAVASTVCMVLYGIAMFLFDASKNVKHKKTTFYKLFNFKTVIPVYLISVIAVIGIQHFGVVQYIVVNWLKKDPTLTTRTIIWDAIILKLIKRPFIGYGILNQQDYIKITLNSFATSAHNLVLAILMAGGLLGGIIYIFIIGNALRRENKQYNKYDIPIVVAILIFLIIGITSESLLYSEFSFVLFYMLLFEKERKGEKNDNGC